MDRIILPYAGGPKGPPSRMHAAMVPAHAETHSHVPTKGVGDYLRALRKRCWLALLIFSVLMVPGAVFVLRQKPVYRTTALIKIEPPQIDTIMASLLAEHEVLKLDASSAEQYESNQLAQLRNAALLEFVLQDPRVQPHPPNEGDLIHGLLENFQATQIPRSTLYNVQLEGTDPIWIAKVLNVWLEKFSSNARNEIVNKVENSKNKAMKSVRVLEGELTSLDDRIQDSLKKSPVLSPNGENMLLRHFEMLGAQKMQKIVRQEELLREVRLSQLFPKPEIIAPAGREAHDLELLYEQEKELLTRWDQVQRTVRSLKGSTPERFQTTLPSDPTARYLVQMLRETREHIRELEPFVQQGNDKGYSDTDPFAYLLNQANQEVARIEQSEEEVFKQIQEMAPEHNRYLTLLGDRARKAESISELRQRVANFDLVAETQNQPVRVEQAATEPVVPVRPNRVILLGLVAMAAVGTGCGLVVLLEHLDHSVRAPEHITSGLSLPLLAVIPRMRRTAKLQRGGHLWTPGLPHSVEADAYRNLRASLVGLTDNSGRPVTTMLVTSAKADEGKSTTALNLAATCARSGERTLLVDVDLRRSSLRDVFDDGEHNLGLVDVLRGELPWQRTLVQTDIANLDFLPVGDPTGIPIEILGSLEMRQLLLALSGHYDRVILDGPAVLGLADCRMLGRVVDTTLLVVRAGANDMRPSMRARAMLDQSQVRLAGVVFNGLSDDANNWWTNYGAHEALGGSGLSALPANRGMEPAPMVAAALGAND